MYNTERRDEKPVGVLLERERPRLAGAAHDASRGAGEPAQMLGLAAHRAGRQLRDDPRREQELRGVDIADSRGEQQRRRAAA